MRNADIHGYSIPVPMPGPDRIDNVCDPRNPSRLDAEDGFAVGVQFPTSKAKYVPGSSVCFRCANGVLLVFDGSKEVAVTSVVDAFIEKANTMLLHLGDHLGLVLDDERLHRAGQDDMSPKEEGQYDSGQESKG